MADQSEKNANSWVTFVLINRAEINRCPVPRLNNSADYRSGLTGERLNARMLMAVPNARERSKTRSFQV